jgi:hypothetical protein
MCNLRHYLWITLSVSALAISAIDPVLAKPQVRSKVIVSSQLPTKAVAIDNSIAPPPINAILANLKLKLAPAKTSSTTRVKAEHPKSAIRVTSTRNINAIQASKGSAGSVKLEQPKRKSNKSSGIDRWVVD